MKHLKITVDGKTFDVTVEELSEKKNENIKKEPISCMQEEKVEDISSISGEKIIVPMAGNIIDVKVATGQFVKKGDVIAIMEIMKMENEIVATVDGKVVALQAKKGQNVAANQIIAVLN